ncbi:MAG: hypothetical protein AAGF07_02985 [Patescibacteria group bacterium]
MPKYIEKHTKKEILVELSKLKSFWLDVKADHDSQGEFSHAVAMDYLGSLKDIWVSKLTPFKNTDDFQVKELFEKSKRIYAKMTIFLEQYIEPVTLDEVTKIESDLKQIIEDILKSRRSQSSPRNLEKTELKKYLKRVIDRLGLAQKTHNPSITNKVKDVDKKLNLIITNDHLYV